MGWIGKLLSTLLIGILSAALAVIFQNDIAAWLGRAPITAEISVGAWHPLLNSKEITALSPDDSTAISSYSDDNELKFARLKIQNKSGRKIDEIYLYADDEHADWIELHAIIVTGKETEVKRSQVSGDSRISLGPIEAASSMIVYVWSNRTFGYPFDLDHFTLVTTEDGISTTVNRFSGDATSYVFGIHTETIAWILLAITLIIGTLFVALLLHQWGYVKALMGSEDYYLEERQRHDGDPSKFTLPDNLPKS